MIFFLFILNQRSFYGTLNVYFRLIMKFVLKPSLEHIAFVKIVVSLWNQKDVRALIIKLCPSDLYSIEKWNTIEQIVIKKVPHLSLPQVLKEKVLDFIKTVGLEVLKWMQFHCRSCNLRAHLPAEFYWTPHGTVDRKRTAEVLVRDENLDISMRYKLACIYCLEDDIQKFWNNMPEDLKESDWDKCEIVSFWSRNMKRRELGNAYIDCKTTTVYYRCVYGGHKVAAKYFLQKLTPREREECLVHTGKNLSMYPDQADILCFLLEEMDEEQQMEVFKHKPYNVLKCFLEWPWQSFFIAIANRMWDFFPKADYYSLLMDIVRKVRAGYKDCNYQELFREFWQKTPNALRCRIDENNVGILQCLFDIKDKENIRLILKDLTITVKEKLLYSGELYYSVTTRSVRENGWDFLEFCIRECFSSKTEMLKFKKEFEKRMMHPYFKGHFARKKHEWDQLFPFSDDSICKYDKRSVEEGESSSSKRFQSLQ